MEDAAQATSLVRALRHPPHGTRGFATYPRSGRFGSVTADEHRAAGEDVLVIAMLESPGALERAGEIVGVDGVDGWLVGVADLGASRTDADPSVAELLAAVRTDPAVRDAVRADLAGSAEAAAASFAGGAQLVVYNLAAVMMASFRELAAATG
nr:aldolase/citrate lyase family protein [Pseudonocardia sp. ICBG1293]